MPTERSPHHLSPGQLTPKLCPESCSIQSTFPIIITAIHPTCKADYTIPLLQHLWKFSFVHKPSCTPPISHSTITVYSCKFSVFLTSKLLFQLTSHPFLLFSQTHRHIHTHLHTRLHKIHTHTHTPFHLASFYLFRFSLSISSTKSFHLMLPMPRTSVISPLKSPIRYSYDYCYDCGYDSSFLILLATFAI